MVLHNQKVAQLHIQSPPESPDGVNLAEAARREHSKRRYHPASVGLDDIQTLLSEAMAATALSQKNPVMFTVLQDKQLLASLSGDAAAYANKEVRGHMPRIYKTQDFDIFHDAETLVVVYADHGTNSDPSACWFVAESIMLGACAMGFNTCLSGLAIAVLNTLWWKERLGVPCGAKAIAPIVIGTLGHNVAR